MPDKKYDDLFAKHVYLSAMTFSLLIILIILFWYEKNINTEEDFTNNSNNFKNNVNKFTNTEPFLSDYIPDKKRTQQTKAWKQNTQIPTYEKFRHDNKNIGADIIDYYNIVRGVNIDAK